jgi:membrane protein implicated in regulation of membrane protease activity
MQNQKGTGAGMTPDSVDAPRASATGFAITVVVALALGFAAMFLASSHTIQVIGFAVVTIVGIVLLIEFRPRRSDRRVIPLRMRTNYIPGTGRVVDPEWREEPGPGREESDPEYRPPRPGRGA